MSKTAVTIIVVLGLLVACLLGVGVGYFADNIYEMLSRPVPVPVANTIEELNTRETITLDDIASVYTSSEEKSFPETVRLATIGKRLQAFRASVYYLEPSKTGGAGKCEIAVRSVYYPEFIEAYGWVDSSWCARLDRYDRVLISGTILTAEHYVRAPGYQGFRFRLSNNDIDLSTLEGRQTPGS